MSRFRTSRRWRSIAAALVAAQLAVTLVTQSSQAVPARDIREVQAQVRDLHGLPAPVKVVRVEGQYPTRDAIAGQEYALTQPLYLITNGAPGGRIRQFIDFVLSPAGQAIVARYHASIR